MGALVALMFLLKMYVYLFDLFVCLSLDMGDRTIEVMRIGVLLGL